MSRALQCLACLTSGYYSLEELIAQRLEEEKHNLALMYDPEDEHAFPMGHGTPDKPNNAYIPNTS